MSSFTSTKQSASRKIEVLEDGLVIIRNFLSVEEQQQLVSGAFEWGSSGEDGFFEVDPATGKRQLNAGKTKNKKNLVLPHPSRT